MSGVSDRCPGQKRHWFMLHGSPGGRTPVCVHCGAANPKPLKDDEWAALEDMLSNGWPVGSRVEAAIRGRRGEHERR